jgi:2'-5' RNA ligase
MPIESVLLVLIPEAEAIVDTFRKRYDPSTALGVPAHVTVLFPFRSPDQLTTETTSTLRDLFSQIPSFTASFPEIQRFPGALFLAPVPAQQFRQLTKMVVKHFPDTPPYGGAFPKIIPHLTIAQVSDSRQLDEIAADFHEAAKDQLPIHTRVSMVTLMENSSGYWQIRAQFPLHPDERG